MTVTYHTENPQEVFDFVVGKLFEQGGKSLMDGNNDLICMYRGEGDRRCALGWLIPDSEYVPDMEKRVLDAYTGQLSNFDSATTLSVKSFRVTHNVHLIRALQMAHDESPTNHDGSWTEGQRFDCLIVPQLRRIASSFNLDSSIIDRTFLREMSGSQD